MEILDTNNGERERERDMDSPRIFGSSGIRVLGLVSSPQLMKLWVCRLADVGDGPDC